jgi:membrane protein required for colicin V production
LNYFDYIIIIILAVGFILGFKDGLVRKIIGLLGIIIGVILALKFSEKAGAIIAPLFNDETYLSEIIAGFLIFIVVIAIASLIKRIIHPSDKVNKFLNQFLGGITGTVQIVFFLSGFLLFLDIFNIPPAQDKTKSLLYGSVYQIVPKTIDLIVGTDEDSKQFIKKYIESRDTASVRQEKDTTLILENHHDFRDSTR